MGVIRLSLSPKDSAAQGQPHGLIGFLQSSDSRISLCMTMKRYWEPGRESPGLTVFRLTPLTPPIHPSGPMGETLSEGDVTC